MKGVYPLTEKEKAHMQILNGMMEHISSISEDIYTAIPMIDRSFSDDTILVKMNINGIKTLGLDKEKKWQDYLLK